MAKRIAGVQEKLLECAREEFLEKGYQDASLRVIAAKAGTSTGSIYTRFGDKEGMFQEIVKPVAARLMRVFAEAQGELMQLSEKTGDEVVRLYFTSGLQELLDYIYGDLDGVRLLLDASNGTKFQDFLEGLVRLRVKYLYKYMQAKGYGEIFPGIGTEEFLHTVTSAYFENVFEAIRHSGDKAAAKAYVEMLEKYHMNGLAAVFPFA